MTPETSCVYVVEVVHPGTMSHLRWVRKKFLRLKDAQQYVREEKEHAVRLIRATSSAWSVPL